MTSFFYKMGWFGVEQEIYLDAKKFVISLIANNFSLFIPHGLPMKPENSDGKRTESYT